MSNILYKTKELLQNHYKKVIIGIIICLMVIGTAIYLIIPNIKTLITYNEILTASGVEEVTGTQEQDLFEQSNNTNSESLVNAEEYKEKQAEIEAMEKRIDAIDNFLTVTLTDCASNFMDAYTKYSSTQNPANLEKLQSFMTEEYSKEFGNADVTEGNYLAYTMWFADLDKDVVSVYVETRAGNAFILQYIDSNIKGWLVCGMEQVK